MFVLSGNLIIAVTLSRSGRRLFFVSFNDNVVILLDWLPAKDRKPSLQRYLAHKGAEKNLIQAFYNGINTQ